MMHGKSGNTVNRGPVNRELTVIQTHDINFAKKYAKSDLIASYTSIIYIYIYIYICTRYT